MDDVVIIRHGVVFDGTADVHSIVIRDGGTLRFDVEGDQSLRVVNLQVLAGGRLETGTEARPHRGKAEIVFKDVPFDPAIDPGQCGNGIVAFGSVSMHGRTLDQTFATLDTELTAGDTFVPDDGVVNDWAAGDRLLIPDSRQLFYTASVSAGLDRYESPVLDSVGDGGLVLDAPLAHDHRGARDADGELVFLPHIANVSMNVVLRSENPRGVRGHTIFIGRAEVDVRYVEFRDLGRTTNSPLDDTRFADGGDVVHRGSNQSSRYPVHLHHLIGPIGGTSSGYQYNVIGNAVHSSVWNLKWGIPIHGSHYGRVHRNVVYNFAGAGIVTEDGSESHNEISENFVSRISGRRDRGKFSDGRQGSGIWPRRPNNFVSGNVVTGVQKSAYAVYGGDDTEAGPSRVPVHQGGDPHNGNYQLVAPKNMHLLSFDNNTAYASHMGLKFWYLGFENYYDPSDEAVSQSNVRSFASWHIHHSAVFGEQANNVVFSDLKAIGSKDVGGRYNSPVGFNVLRAVNVVVENAKIANRRFGIVSPNRVERRGRETPLASVSPVVVRGEVLSNEVNVRVNTPSEDAIGAAAPRHSQIEDVVFEANSVFTGGRGYDILMSYDDGGFTNTVDSQTLFRRI